MVRPAVVVGVVGVFGAVACGGAYRKVEPAPAVTRAPTAGDAALALLPAGADVVIELDLARARANPTIGPLVDRWAGALDQGAAKPCDGEAGASGPMAGQHGVCAVLFGGASAPLAGAAWVVLAAYDVGKPDAATVTLVAPGTGVEIPNAVKIADGVVALAPPAWIDKLAGVDADGSLAGDRELVALRARAMPVAAEGAVLRLTARLSTDARIGLASALGLEPAPRAVSAWADVADDAALVVDLDARDEGDPAAVRRLRRTIEALIHRVAGTDGARALGLAPPIARTRIEGGTRTTWLRAITVIPPSRLGYAAAELQKGAP